MKGFIALFVFAVVIAAGFGLLGATFAEAAVGAVAVVVAVVVSATLHGKDDTPSA